MLNRRGYAPHSYLVSKPFEASGMPPTYETMHKGC